jgi:hypothetical protein
LTRSNWIEDFVLPPAVAVLNTAWLWLWVTWSVRAAPREVIAEPISPVLLAVLLLSGFAVTRWAMTTDPATRDPRPLIAASGILLVLGAIWQSYGFSNPTQLFHALVDWGNFVSPVFLGLLACAYMWLQGIRLGRSTLPQENLERAFYGGILALGLLFAVNQLRPLVTAGQALLAALAFFATGLGSLALVSVEHARRWPAGQGGHWPGLNRYWLGTVAGVIGSILLTGLVVARLLSPQSFARIGASFEIVVNVITIAFVVFIGTLVFVAVWLLEPVLQQLANAFSQINLQLPRLPDVSRMASRTVGFFERYPALNFARQWFALVLIVGGLVLAFWWAVRRFSRWRRRDVDETRESIATLELLLHQLRSLLRRRPPAVPTGPAYLLLVGPRDDPRLMVRRAYQAMLEWAPALNLPRRLAGQTPAAYAATLRHALPDGRMAIDALTGAYLQARYAAEAPSMEIARSAEGAVNQLRSLTANLNRTNSTRRPA